jgi:hypothetical protein
MNPIMLKRNLSLMTLFIISLFLPFTLLAAPIVVDHTCTDVSKIPDNWIEQVRKMIVQYVGESHGRQVPHGLALLAAQDEKYKVQIGDGENDKIDVLTDTTALRILRTQKNTYGPINGDELYWATETARGYTEATAQDAVDKGTPLAVSLWCWCWDMSSENWVHDESGAVITYNDERNEAYLNAIRRFNTNRPQTKFIYHTGVTDVQVSAGGWRSTYYNGIIRTSATTDGGILFDQADIENWNEAGTQQRTETWNDNGTMRTIYVRNNDYDETVGTQFQPGHTNDALCLKKAKAFWWMLARIAGWDGTTEVEKQRKKVPQVFNVLQNYPNPFNPSTKIQFIVPSDGHVRIRVYNCLGQIVATPYEGEAKAGQYQTVQIDGTSLSSGVYFYSVEHKGQLIAKRMVLIK